MYGVTFGNSIHPVILYIEIHPLMSWIIKGEGTWVTGETT